MIRQHPCCAGPARRYVSKLSSVETLVVFWFPLFAGQKIGPCSVLEVRRPRTRIFQPLYPAAMDLCLFRGVRLGMQQPEPPKRSGAALLSRRQCGKPLDIFILHATSTLHPAKFVEGP